MIKIFEKNLQGLDYICSDIHGCFELLEKAMDLVNFDPSLDRIFSLGDLIDRGDNSLAALKWLNEPWFHSILGNHEWMFIEAFERYEKTPTQNNRERIADGWTSNLSIEEIKTFYKAFCKLPLAIEINISDEKCIGMVHAQLPRNCDWAELKTALISEDVAYISNVIDELLWFKYQANKKHDNNEPIRPVKNIHHVFHGHTILPSLYTLTNRTFLDLGSYKTGKIGFLEPVSFLKLPPVL